MQNPEQEMQELHKQMQYCREKMVELKKTAMGRKPVKNYTFKLAEGGTATMKELFGNKDELIVVHNMGKQCSYCTLWADGFNGQVDHFEDRAGFVVISPDSPEDQRAFAKSRGWRFKMASHQGTNFAADMGITSKDYGTQPGFSTFKKRGEEIVRVAHDYFGPGDDYCGVWHMFAHLDDSHESWGPKKSYK